MKVNIERARLIVLRVGLGQDPLPDETHDEREYRIAIEVEVRAAFKAGLIVDVPGW